MDSFLSNSVQNIEISGIRKFYNKVLEYPNAISLTLGQPDFNVPQRIKEAMIKAVEENMTVYTSNAGLVELREEISRYISSMNINYSKDDICVTVGGSEGLVSVFTAILNEGDGVLIPTPAYPAYESCVKILKGRVINYNLSENFSINFDELEKLIKNQRPKAMVISYPSNPTGAVLSLEDRERLHDLIRKNDIIVITDEIYSAICFDDSYYSVAQYSDIKEKVIVVSGFSKMFSMTGLRIGYICAVKRFMDQIIKVHQYYVSCAPSIAQYGALEGLRNCMSDVKNMKKEFEIRRNYIYNRLTSMGLDTFKPRGAFYIFPSIKRYNMSSERFCERLLDEAGIAVVPGSAFGKGGEGYIRISYAYSVEKLKECSDRMENWMKKII